MNLKPFGNTTLSVTPLGLGLAALGRPGYINLGHAQDLDHNYQVGAMTAHTHTVLDAAWDAGIRYYDAARSYGAAESFLASWLTAHHIPPETVTVGSKWGYTYTADWQVEAKQHEVKQHSLATLQRQIAESRAFLGNHLDLYQIHSATLESGVLTNQPVLNQLAHLRDSGLVIGLSLSGPGQAETLYRAMELFYDGRPLFMSVQATWNLLETSAAAALSAAHAAGMGVIVKEALANGRLTPRNQEPAFQPKYALLAEMAAEQGTTIDALALAAALTQPWADVVLSGATTVEQLQSNLNALNVVWSPATAARLTPLAEPPQTYWQTRSQLDWN